MEETTDIIETIDTTDSTTDTQTKYIVVQEVQEPEPVQEGLYESQINALNALVVQNYIIIGMLFITILLKRKWRNI